MHRNELDPRHRIIPGSPSTYLARRLAPAAFLLLMFTGGSLAWAQTAGTPPAQPPPDGTAPDATPPDGTAPTPPDETTPTPSPTPPDGPDATVGPTPPPTPPTPALPPPTPPAPAVPDVDAATPDADMGAADGTTDDATPESTDPGSVDEYDDQEVIIVTGTADGGEMRKFDASFAITTMGADDITIHSPKSTADLLELVPGVWAESSGGVAGANVFVRGFPSAGDAPYLTVQVNGAPIFPPPTLSFLENTTLFRIDETVERVEALRGGPNPVFSNGQPGLTTNFILREGGKETEGQVKYTTSTYDLRRFDAYLSGELADRFYYMVGGYISGSPGIRDAGFTSEEGNQFTINLNKDMDYVSINFFHRRTDDSGTWYLPVALNVPGVDARYNQLGVANRQRSIITGNNNNDPAFTGTPTRRTLDLGEGRGWDGSVSGGSINYFPGGGWTMTDRFSFTTGDADTLGLVPDGGAVRVSDLMADPTLDERAVITGPLTGRVTGRPISPTEYIQAFGAWEVRKDIGAFTNDLSLAKKTDRAKFTAGIYSAIASTDEVWALGNARYEVVGSDGEVVDGIECNDPDLDGCGFNYDIDATGDVTTTALYAAASFDVVERLTADLGVRGERHQVDYSVDEGVNGLVDFEAEFDEVALSFTAGANYLVTDTIGTFARLNRGSKMPNFDDFRDNREAFQNGNDLIQQIQQYELGFKWVTNQVRLYATGFYTHVDPTFFVTQPGAGAVIQTQRSGGVELDAVWLSGRGLNVSLNATLQDTKIVDGPNAGKNTPRQPNWQLRLTPSYSFKVRQVDATVYGTISAVGDRYGEPENVNVLEGYQKLDLGAIVEVSKAFMVQVAADNITDTEGLTESDPRTILAPNGRYIMPRTFKLSVGYKF